jgi:hypothetical protein
LRGKKEEIMRVVAIETRNNRSNGVYSGFYGDEALNQKRRKFGEQFNIRDDETDTAKRLIGGEEQMSEREERQDHVNRKLVQFNTPQDRDAYIKYRDFAPWMTVDMAYQPKPLVRKEQGKIRTADSHDDAETRLPAMEPLPEGGHEGDVGSVATQVRKKAARK